MDEKTALHTAAQRYCLERAPGLDPRHEEQWYRDRRWKRKNRELVSVWSDSRGTVAQIDVSGAILFEIERFVPENFASVHALRAFLTTVAQEVFAPNDPDTTMEHDREKALFQHYIELLSEHDLHNVAPLPYRRVLKKHELDTMWERVEHQWGITPKMGWYPLSKVSLPPHVVAFQEDWFAYSIPPEALRELLKQHDMQRVWELRQGNVSYQ